MPGANKAAEINAAIAGVVNGGTVRLVTGMYTLETNIVVERDDVTLRGEGGGTVMVPTWDGTGMEDDPTNAAVIIQGTAIPSILNTDLSAPAQVGVQSVSLIGLGTLAPGDFIFFEGHNTSGDSLNDTPGTNVSLKEIAQVTSTWGGTNPVTLTRALTQYHASGAPVTVKAFSPRRNVVVRDFMVDASGLRIATGVNLASCLNPIVDIQMKGAARSIIEVGRGTSGFQVHAHGLGENNCAVFLESAMHGKVLGTNDGTGPRVHAYGVTRQMVTWRNRTTDVDIEAQFSHVSVGIGGNGGVSLRAKAVLSDCDGTEFQTRGLVAGECLGTFVGSGVHQGTTAVATYGEYAWDCEFDYKCFETLDRAMWLNDCRDTMFDLDVVSRGVVANSAVTVDDPINCTFRSINTNGYRYGLEVMTTGAVSFNVGKMVTRGLAGVGAAANVALYLNQISDGTSITVDELDIYDANPVEMFFGTIGKMVSLNIKSYNGAVMETRGRTVMGYAAMGVNDGYLVTLVWDAINARYNIAYTTSPAPLCGLVMGHGEVAVGWHLVLLLPAEWSSNVALDTASVYAEGDFLEAGSGGVAFVNNRQASQRTPIGRNMIPKAAGVIGTGTMTR